MPRSPHISTPNARARKPAWVQAFLDALGTTGNVTLACKAADVERSTPYHRRKTNPEFGAAWTEAMDRAGDLLEAEARRRATVGTDKPVFYKGVEVGAIRVYSDRLLEFLLKGAKPDKYRDQIQIRNIPTEALEDELRRLEALEGLEPGEEFD